MPYPSIANAAALARALFIGGLFFFAFALSAFAAEPNITFPISALGGCESKQECKTYCDDPSHIDACVSFAETNGLMTPGEAAQARAFAGQTGPGGCRGSECRAFCSDSAHRDECVAFAKEHNLTPPSPQGPHIGPGEVHEPEIDEDKAMRIVEAEGGPGGCRTKDECRAFCDIEGNIEECFAFAAEHGLMSSADLERARKMLSATGPGGCRGIECRAYCESAGHEEECLAFAEEQGFIPPEEAALARKLLSTTGPGGCRGPEECSRYCSEHPDECKGFGPPHSGSFEPFDGRDFGERRALDERGFEIPPGIPCSTPEECRAFYEKNNGNFGPGAMPPLSPEFHPPEGTFPPPEGFRQEYEERYRSYYEGGEGDFREFQMQEGYPMPSEYPSGSEYQAPPENTEPAPSEPSSRFPSSNFVASVLSAVAQFLGF